MSGERNHSTAVVQALSAAARNPLAPRGGLQFDGGTNIRAYSTLTNQSIGTSAMAWVGTFAVPTNLAASRGIFMLSPAGAVGATSLFAYVETDNTLQVHLSAATSADRRKASVAAFATNFAGKLVNLAVVRTASTLQIFINGALQVFTESTSGTPPAWTDSIASTIMDIGSLGTSGSYFVGTIHSASLYNLALSAAEVQEIFELGGAVPDKFYGGAQQAIANVSRNSQFAEASHDWGSWNTNVSLLTAAGKLVATSFVNDGGPYFDIASMLVANYRKGGVRQNYQIAITFDLSGWVGTGTLHATLFGGVAAQQNVGTYSADGTYTATFAIDAGKASRNIGFLTSISGTATFSLDNIVVKIPGCICHLPFDDGVGIICRDAMPNGNHALLVSGVNRPVHLIDKLQGRVRGITNTNGNQQLYGQVVIPGLSQLVKIRARSRSGTPTITIGSASAGSQLVASVALSTTWKDLTIALTGGIVSSDMSVWVGSNSTDWVELDIAYEPLLSP